MKNIPAKRIVSINPNTRQWKHYQHFADFTKRLDTLPDTGQVQANPPKSAPPELTVMVF